MHSATYLLYLLCRTNNYFYSVLEVNSLTAACILTSSMNLHFVVDWIFLWFMLKLVSNDRKRSCKCINVSTLSSTEILSIRERSENVFYCSIRFCIMQQKSIKSLNVRNFSPIYITWSVLKKSDTKFYSM